MPLNPDRFVVDRADRGTFDPANRPSSEGIRAGAPLALEIIEKGRGVFRGLLVALLAVASSACLVPQSVDANSSQHTVPVIDLSSVPLYAMSPTPIPTYLQTPKDKAEGCRCQLKFENFLFVTDPDPTVDLQARWYIDYDVGIPGTQGPSIVPIPGSFSANGNVRGPISFTFDPDALNLTNTDADHNNGLHIIEVVIAEAEGFAPDTASNVRLPHRSLNKGWDATTLKFVVKVNVSQGDQCDRNTPLLSPPFARVCGS